MFRRLFTVATVLSLAIGFAVSWFDSAEERIWFYPGANYGIDRDHQVIIRCGSGAQNLFFLPLDFLLFPAFAMPLLWLVSRRASASRSNYLMYKNSILRKRKICVTCGYDVRATPDRCPECGTATTEFHP